MRNPSQRFLTQRSWVCSSCRATRPPFSPRFFSSQPALRADKRKSRREILPDAPARTRFAPSPTGYLHLGSLRTALFNYLLAKRTGGQFVLRIEDTDQKRTIPGAEQRLCEDLQWAGLQWDEGPIVGGPYGPYQQSKRTELYRQNVQNLITSKHAYRCFCSPDRLDTMARHRNEAGLPPGYDRTCADIPDAQSEEKAANGEPHVVRLRVDEAYPMFDDLVFGKTGQNRLANSKSELMGKVYDDPILLKTDGHPTYHLANVVDDHNMQITHVVRGTEWMSSTPMHMALYNAFNWEPPKFGHVPLLVEKSGQKLSKRNSDIDITFFKDKLGIFPETLVNFAALLGWSHSQKSDTFSLEDLERIFNLKLTKGNTIVAFEKLWFLQKSHAQRYAGNGGPQFEAMVKQVSDAAQKEHQLAPLAPILQGRSLEEYISPLLQADAKSYTTANEFLNRNQSFFSPTLTRPSYSLVTTQPSSSSDPTLLSSLHTTAAAFSLVPSSHWTAETHRANISCVTTPPPPPATDPSPEPTTSGDKAFKKELYHYLRWALSGGAPGPGIPETMEILGRAESVRRLKEAERITSEGTDAVRGDVNRRVKSAVTPGGGVEDKSWMGSLAGK